MSFKLIKFLHLLHYQWLSYCIIGQLLHYRW